MTNPPPSPDESRRRSGVVAVIGAPNAGKSTLVNHLVGAKVSAVTHKVQTTRFSVRGVAVRGDVQIVLVDTPGVFEPKRRLDRAMVRSAWDGTGDADAVIHLVDAPSYARFLEGRPTAADKHTSEDVDRINARLKKRALGAGGQAILALNKIDAMERDRLFLVTRTLHQTDAYSDVFMISAEKGYGVDDLWALLAQRSLLGPWLYPEDQTADAPIRLLAAEITREKLMLRLHEEIPYEATVETETWEEKKDGSTKIEQTVYVARESQRKIVLGKGGAAIKAIGQSARIDMEKEFGRRVHLFLHVKVRENWGEERARYDALGLDFDA
jgi:GTPase